MEKNFAHCATKKINILTLVLSGKKILNETKNHNPPFKLNGRSLNRSKVTKKVYDRSHLYNWILYSLFGDSENRGKNYLKIRDLLSIVLFIILGTHYSIHI